MSHACSAPWIRRMVALVLVCGLGACSVDTTVSVGASTPAQIQHLYVTVEGVWLSTDAAAADAAAATIGTSATGGGWVGQKLSTPLSIDLASLNGGTLTDLVSGIKTAPGTYRRLRLDLADSSAALTDAARTAGLSWNAQVQYLSTTGTSQSLALELPSPASPLIIPVSIEIRGAGATPFLAGGIDTSSSGATLAVGSGTASTTDRVAIDIQAERNWILFEYDGSTGALLAPLILAYDADTVGGITGTLDMSAAAAATLTGPQGIVVTAEKLSADGTRYEPVKSVSVSGSGAFTLYPLPVADTANGSSYEIVIHGPGIRSIVISQVPVKAGAASAATSLQDAALTLTKARHYTVNAAANSAPLPGGSRVGFYQMLPGFTAPHLIEYAAADPFNGGFSEDVSLSADVVDHGDYADGASITLNRGTPEDGVGTYRVGADSALRNASALSSTISAPTLSASGVQPIFLPGAGTALGGATMRLNGTLSLATPGRFDRGFVLISRGGELIDSLDLKASLSGLGSTASFTLPSIPAGNADGRYDVAVRLWNSRNPSGTLTRAAAAGRLDGSGGGVQTVNIVVP